MMKKLLIILGVVIFGINGNSQQLMFSGQYMLNHYLTNPGAAGAQTYAPIAINVRQQWVGFEGAPSTQTFSANSRIGNHNGVGFMFYHDLTGPLRRYSVQGTYAYHVEFKNKTRLGLGLSLFVNQHILDGSTFNLASTTDQLLTNAVLKSTNFDANFGAYYKADKYYVGISIPQLLQNKYKFGDNIEDASRELRHFYAMGGYVFDLNDEWKVEPSVLFKGVAHAPVQFDINTRFIYNDMCWFGASWRVQESVVPMAGVLHNNFVFGYCYDITTTNLRHYSAGSHELYFSYRIPENVTEKFGTSRMD